ncbi:MAG: hypothetical protein ACQER9_02375 [Nanobdellota archaeon]
MVRNIRKLAENPGERASESQKVRNRIFQVRFPANRRGKQDTFSSRDNRNLSKINSVLNLCESNEEFSKEVADLVEAYQKGTNDLFPDHSSYLPIILATRTHPESLKPYWNNQKQQFRLWFDFPSVAAYDAVDSMGSGMFFSIQDKNSEAIDQLIEKIDLPFLEEPKYTLPSNGTEIYSSRPIAICRLTPRPTTIGAQRYLINDVQTDFESRIQDENNICEELVYRDKIVSETKYAN